VRLAMGSDVVIVGPREREDFVPEQFPDDTWTNEYHMRMRQGDLYVEVIDYPLKDAETRADVDAYQWPEPHHSSRYKDAEYYVQKYKDEYVVIGDIEVTILSLAQQLVGMEKMMVDMATEEEYLVYLFEKCGEFQTQVGLELIRRGVDAIWLGDDFGSQMGLLFSKEMFRSMLKPYYIRMIETFKKANPNIIPILHCDGAVKELLVDIKEMGIDVFNPVQPNVPGHGAEEIKGGFGNMLAFWGAIDQQRLLPNGTDEEVEKDIREKIAVLGRGGGYMISPAHILQPDVSPDRVEFFIKKCKEYGAY
jgi:uroporphyrinogen decarboxylase